MTTPKTEAGKALLKMLDHISNVPHSGVSFPDAEELLAEVEAQTAQAAVAQERERIKDGINSIEFQLSRMPTDEQRDAYNLGLEEGLGCTRALLTDTPDSGKPLVFGAGLRRVEDSGNTYNKP